MTRRRCLTIVFTAFVALAAAWRLGAGIVGAQEATPLPAGESVAASESDEPAALPERLLDRQPFDRVTLNAANGGAALDTVLLDLPARRVPNPLPTSGDLELRLPNQPATPYTVAWQDVAKIELYEGILLAEAERLSAAGQFAESFDYLAALKSNYPDMPGLEEELQAYLWRDASTAFAAGDGDGAWPSLVALYDRNPQYPRLLNAVQAVSDGLIDQRLAEKNYAAARAVLELLGQRFPDLPLTNMGLWRQRFETDARAQLARARSALAAKDFDAARDAAMYAYAILPELDEAQTLIREIQAMAPEVRVGVTQAAAPASLSQTPSWAAARGVELVDPRLVEMVAFGNEGGEYASRFGEMSTSDSGLETTLQLSPAAQQRGVTPQAVALQIAAMARRDGAEGQADLAALVKGVTLADGDAVTVQWRRPHLHPEALLAAPLRRVTDAEHGAGLWLEPLAAVDGADEIRYKRTGPLERAAGAPRFVIEHIYADDDAALTALIRGEVDAVDRVPPWQVDRMRAVSDVVVAQYRTPTVHVLVPNPASELLAMREFRRAVCYGIDREGIVKDILLGGEARPGFRAVSGPFPAGTSLSDPMGYAYNPDLAPRPYEPRLAALLANVARTTLAKRHEEERKAADAARAAAEAASTGESPEQASDDSAYGPEAAAEPEPAAAAQEAAADDKLPPPEPLVIAHPADSLARVSCQAIKLQLERVGIPVKLVELPAQQPDAEIEYDLLYVELAVREPLVDARRVLADDGAAGRASAVMMAALDNLDQAQNWNAARSRLREIHRLAYYELPVIPLWQTVNWLAYRTWLEGVGEEPVTLYQNLDAWRKEFGG